MSLYILFFYFIAINAANQFGWGKSFFSGIVVPLVFFGFVACGTIVVLSLLGPQIGDVFSDIIRTLETPNATGA